MEGRPEKRPRIEVVPNLASSTPIEEAPQSPRSDLWRPDIEGMLGRPLAAIDRAGNDPMVVAALGRAYALPLDMERWKKMDNELLQLLSMRSGISVNS